MDQFELIMSSWTSPDNLVSLLGAEVTAEARRRVEEPIRVELYARAAERLAADLVRLDKEITALDEQILALSAELAEKKIIHGKLQSDYQNERPALQTMARGQEVEVARRQVFGVTEKLDHVRNERNGKYTRRQSTVRALALAKAGG